MLRYGLDPRSLSGWRSRAASRDGGSDEARGAVPGGDDDPVRSIRCGEARSVVNEAAGAARARKAREMVQRGALELTSQPRQARGLRGRMAVRGRLMQATRRSARRVCPRWKRAFSSSGSARRIEARRCWRSATSPASRRRPPVARSAVSRILRRVLGGPLDRWCGPALTRGASVARWHGWWCAVRAW